MILAKTLPHEPNEYNVYLGSHVSLSFLHSRVMYLYPQRSIP